MRAVEGIVGVREQRAVIVERDVVDIGVTLRAQAADGRRNPRARRAADGIGDGLGADDRRLGIEMADGLEQMHIGVREFLLGRRTVRVGEVIRAERDDDGIDGKILRLPVQIMAAALRIIERPRIMVGRMHLMAGPGLGVVVQDAFARFCNDAELGIEHARELRRERLVAVLDVVVVLSLIVASFLYAIVLCARRDRVADELDGARMVLFGRQDGRIVIDGEAAKRADAGTRFR